MRSSPNAVAAHAVRARRHPRAYAGANGLAYSCAHAIPDTKPHALADDESHVYADSLSNACADAFADTNVRRLVPHRSW